MAVIGTRTIVLCERALARVGFMGIVLRGREMGGRNGAGEKKGRKRSRGLGKEEEEEEGGEEVR